MTARPKFDYVRSPALMKAYRVIPCQICGIDDGTVVGAHSNWSQDGKGRSIKASDDKCASLCHACHMEIDQGKALAKDRRANLWELAHERTVRLLVALRLWPASVPVPGLRDSI